MRLRLRAGVAALASAGLLLAACGNDGSADSGSGDGTLTFWVMKGTNPDAKAFYKEAKQAFKDKTGATLKIQEVEWASAHDKLVTAFAGGTGPDVSEIGTTWTPEFAAAGGLADITDKVKSSGAAQGLIPALEDSATYNGKLYGVGWYAGARSMIYRKDVFADLGLEPPKNWDQLESVIDTIAEEKPDIMPMPVAGDSPLALLSFIWGTDGKVAEQSGDEWSATIDSSEAQEGIQYYADLALKHDSSSAGAATWKETDLLDSFSKGNAAMAIEGNWTAATVVENNPDLKGKIGAFPLPGQDGGLAPTFVGGSNLSILAQSDNKDLAWEFIEMMTTGDLATKWAKQTGYFPSTTERLKPFAQSDDPLVAPFATQMLKAGRNVPNAPQWGAVEGNKTLSRMMQQILTGTSVDKATKKAAESITKTLNKS